MKAIENIKDLAHIINDIRKEYVAGAIENLLLCKWRIGQAISIARSQQNEPTYRELAVETGMDPGSLLRCSKFYEKYPKQDYELKPWRNHIGILEGKKEEEMADKECQHKRLMCAKCGKIIRGLDKNS